MSCLHALKVDEAQITSKFSFSVLALHYFALTVHICIVYLKNTEGMVGSSMNVDESTSVHLSIK